MNLKRTNLAPEAIVDYFNNNKNRQADTYTPVKLIANLLVLNPMMHLLFYLLFFVLLRLNYLMLNVNYLLILYQAMNFLNFMIV